MSNYTYLLINLLSISVPFAYSFTAHSGFSKQFPRVFAAIFLVGVPMVAWDVWFTANGVWWFNADYHLGFHIFGLPLEEIMFFICIPFACLFIYDSVKKFPRMALPETPVRITCGILAGGLLLVAVTHLDRAYTALCFTLAAVFLIALAAGRLRHRVGHIATAFLLHLIPFFIVNGLLTGIPVVLYNDAQNLGIRMGTIPVEDMFYSLILLVGGIFVLEADGSARRTRV